MFFSAMLGYLVLFWIRLPKRSVCQKSEKLDAPSELVQQTPIAYGGADSCASFEQASTVSLVDIVQSMRNSKKETQTISSELASFFKKNPEACAMSNVMLFSVAWESSLIQ